MPKIYELYAELRDSNPMISRVFRVDENSTVADVVYVLQTLFEMKASHLFKVIVPKGEMLVDDVRKMTGSAFDETAFRNEHPDLHNIRYTYELLDLADFESAYYRSNTIVHNVVKETLKHAVSKIHEHFEVWYDFGDDWFLDVTLQNIIDVEEVTSCPNVVTGVGFGIIEDCGGVDRLSGIIRSYKKKQSKMYKMNPELLGPDEFDFDYFDVDQMNQRLQVIPAIYKRAYENKLAPTQAEIDFIDRNQGQ